MSGCAYDKHEFFQTNVQWSVGHSIDVYWGTKLGEGGYGPPGLLEVQIVDSSTMKYVYGKGNECRWFFLVEKETGIIKDWDYLASPEKCTLTYGAPK